MTAALRSGLPRTRGGAPWPGGPDREAGTRRPSLSSDPSILAGSHAAGDREARTVVASVPAREPRGGASPLRVGLPRTAGGTPWPPAGGLLATSVAASTAATGSSTVPMSHPVERSPTATHSEAASASVSGIAPATAPAVATGAMNAPVLGVRDLSPRQLALGVGLAFFAAVGVVTTVVLSARGVAELQPVAALLGRYDGSAPLPPGTPAGIPAFVSWQHALNMLLMVLVVRTGIDVRRGPARELQWRSHTGRTAGLTVFLHQALDVVWLVNGVVYVALLVPSGHWARIVPSSWEIVPQAAAAAVRYLTLRWPTSDGWADYNALQQLSYAGVVFVLTPLAIVTGLRMSTLWPARPAMLSSAVPIAWARRVHFPVMGLFVLFVVVHVTLVLMTGVVSNLSAMYGGHVWGSAAAVTLAAMSVVVSIGAAALVRPGLALPLARALGTVTRR